MASAHEASTATRFRVGIFTLLGLLLVGTITVLINDRPFWWRSCQLVHINVEDATGLKTKSPVRTLGIQIGFLKDIDLFESHVQLGICITAPVEVLPTTRAYIRGEGFLGDKFVELKPVRYVGERPEQENARWHLPARMGLAFLEPLILPAYAAKSITRVPSREIPVAEGSSQDVQEVVEKVDGLVKEMTNLTENLKTAINPSELRQTMHQLNTTLEHASRTLSPEGNLTTTAQRTLAKLEQAIEQLRDQITRINQGEGSLGKVLNDPRYAEKLDRALDNLNSLLNKADRFRFVVDTSADYLGAYKDARGTFKVSLWPTSSRYYLLGLSMDPRGVITTRTVETTAGSSSAVTVKSVETEKNGIRFTAMLGKVFWDRLELAVGILHNDGTGTIAFHLGPNGSESRYQLRNDIYAGTTSSQTQIDLRSNLFLKPFSIVYFRGGVESIRKVNNQFVWSAGAGIEFDDDDIKFIFSFL